MKIGVMNNPSASVYDEVVRFGEAHFDFVDLTMEGPMADRINVGKLLPILGRYNLSVVGHTDPGLPWAYPVPEIRKACLKELARCAKIFSNLGARIMNIHPCYACPPAMRSSVVAHNVDALKPIVEMAASYGLLLVLENFRTPFDRVSIFKMMMEQVTGLKLHLDFGHTHFGTDTFEMFCDNLGAHIEHVHFSDNRSYADDHMPLGVGSIDWKKAVRSLKATGYDDTITLEVFCNDPVMRFNYLNLNREFVSTLWNS